MACALKMLYRRGRENTAYTNRIAGNEMNVQGFFSFKILRIYAMCVVRGKA